MAIAQQPGADLVQLINRYRSEPQKCEGKHVDAPGPLAPEPRLQRVKVTQEGEALKKELDRVGYAAARAQYVVVTGPQDARAAMRVLRERYCTTLLSTSMADIGVQHDGRTWHIMLASPLLSPALGNWQGAGRKILECTNAARSQARTCGEKRFEAAPPLTWSGKLASAALTHSRDMAERDRFAQPAACSRSMVWLRGRAPRRRR